MKIKHVTIGADPEIFIIDKKTGKVVSAIGLIPGEKDNAYTKGMPKGFGVEIDGILGEFNIPPCSSKEEFVDSIKYMKNWIRDYVKNVNPDYDVLCKAEMDVPKDQLKAKEANAIGCMPDFNAYTEEQNPKPTGYPDNRRCSGFHIHVGYDKHNIEDSVKLVKYFDLVNGVPSVLVDKCLFRRTLYGQAGSFRIQPWGVEARCLSGYILNDEFLPSVYDRTMKVIEMFNEDIPLPDGDLVQKCINTCNEVLAKHLMQLYALQ